MAALEEAVMSVDELIDFAGSDAGKQVFGDKQAEVLAHAKELKAQGAAHCELPRLHAGL